MKLEKRKPWFKFFGRDWRTNPKLRLCAPASRGIWVDLLTLMAEATPRGFLLVEGIAPSAAELAALIGTPEKLVRMALDELGAKRVYSVVGKPMPEDVEALVPEDMAPGVILSRRMVRDEAKAIRDKANGGSGGNPALKPQQTGRVN